MRTGLKLFDKKVVNIVIDENRVERDVDYDGPLAPVTGPWTENAPDAQVTSRFVLLVLSDHLFDIKRDIRFKAM